MKAKKEIPFPLFMLTMLLVIMESTTADEGDAMSNTNYFVKAALVGEKGHVELDFFRDAAEILLRNTTEYEEQENCTIQFIPLEFDLNNASNVLQNLTHAHRLFKQSEVDVAIGPFIDHFTSPNYVIMEPTCHYLTTSSAYVRKSENKDRIRTLLPDLEDFSTAVAKVMEKLGWKQVVFLSDDDFSPILKLRESNILVNPILLPSMHHLGSGHDPLYETLRTLRSSEWPNFVLHSSNLGIVRKVLKKAKDMHLLFGELNWFVTYLNFRALESTISDKSLTNIYGLELVNESMIPKEIISNHSEKSILDIAVTVDLINILLHISGRKCQTKPEPEKFNKMEVPYVGALGYYFLQNDRRTNYVIKIQTPKELVGSINVTDTGVSVEVQTREKKDGISPFGKNETLRIVMGEALPFIKYDSNTKKFSGFCYDILQKLSTILNFKYEIQFVNRDEENQQSYNTNPSVDFLIDQLVSGNASMAIGAIPMSSKKEMIVSSSYSILTSKTSILIHRPKSEPQFFQFLSPFSENLWYSLVLFMLVVTFALFLMSRYDQTQEKTNFNLKESLWYSLNVLLNNGTEYSPQTTSTRTIIAFYWFCILIINAAYTANLTAFLTKQRSDQSIKTIRQLVDQSQYEYGILNDSDLKEFFQTSQKDPYERMWLQMQSDELIIDQIENAIDKVRKNNFALINDQIVNEYYAGKNCELESHTQPIEEKSYAFAFPKGAPYRDEINRVLLELKENGTLDKIKNDWLFGKCGDQNIKDRKKEKENSALKFEDMMGLFIVMAASAAIAVLFEILRQIHIYIQTHCKTKPNFYQREVKEKELEINEERFL
ncbi:glutamate receptor ionotropic, kainate 2-like isoform X1 [Octopus sinensis]|uniref:Glutamate receptor ionotropic, kainate 2-like isoform X1 n=1 Tax=Octopus sinensis TaxID=2607531 RepID=A0A7E6EZM3_9MOLL|nr:glutamate receptor ionotropic, kainate 2-like isoform X1 [Octopus sinensis]